MEKAPFTGDPDHDEDLILAEHERTDTAEDLPADNQDDDPADRPLTEILSPGLMAEILAAKINGKPLYVPRSRKKNRRIPTAA